jgi:hypothetical protein
MLSIVFPPNYGLTIIIPTVELLFAAGAHFPCSRHYVYHPVIPDVTIGDITIKTVRGSVFFVLLPVGGGEKIIYNIWDRSRGVAFASSF